MAPQRSAFKSRRLCFFLAQRKANASVRLLKVDGQGQLADPGRKTLPADLKLRCEIAGMARKSRASFCIFQHSQR